MRVLLLGATGNLGSRLVPALLAHKHEPILYVRSPDKLHSLMPDAVLTRVKIHQGDGLDSKAIEAALLQHDCEVMINVAHNFTGPLRKQSPETIAAAALTAAINAGKARGKPLRAWQTGGLGSLVYPGTGGYKIQDYLPNFVSKHHQVTERMFKAIPVTDLRWTVLCVAMMYPVKEHIVELKQPYGNSLSVAVDTVPDTMDHWSRHIPFLGDWFNLIPLIRSCSTDLEEVADLIAEQLEVESCDQNIGQFIGMKKSKSKTPKHE